MIDLMTTFISTRIPYIFIAGASLLALGSLFLSLHTKKRWYGDLTVLCSVVLFMVLCLSFYGYTVDDAYISLRFARNFADGHGFVFNTDGTPPVEGYTNFLWVLLEVPLFYLRLSDEWILHAVKSAGILFGTGTILLTCRLGRRIAGDTAGEVAALMLSCTPFLAFWSIGGLETSMYIFFAVAAVSSMVSEYESGRKHLVSFACLCGMALTRPEGLFFAAAITVAITAIYCARPGVMSRRGRARNVLAGAGLFVLCFGIYFLWRWHFYGYPFPNTFYAKRGDLSLMQIQSRLREMGPFLRYIVPVVVVGLISQPFLIREKSPQRLLVLSAFVLLFAFSFAARREHMPGYRYEIPFMPFAVCLAAAGLRQVWSQKGDAEGSIRSLLQGCFLSGFVCLNLILAVPECRNQRRYTVDEENCHVALGKWLNRHAPPDSSYASWDMGAVPYFSRLKTIIDIHPEGLLDSHTAHNGYDAAHFLALRPTFLVLPPPAGQATPHLNIFTIRDHSEFQAGYEYLFTVTLRPDYLMEVHMRRETPLSSEALKEGILLSEATRARWTQK